MIRASASANRPPSSLPNSLKALEAEIQAAVESGITVVFSAGNGHYSFPGMMPEVIAAGGVFVDAHGAMKASDYASAFPSAIYSGRSVPDFCGLVGMKPHADYSMLPVPAAAEIDQGNAEHDGTKPNDAWAVFSGTSAAAPQLVGVCALPSLKLLWTAATVQRG
jgi:subtilisin family serine protease